MADKYLVFDAVMQNPMIAVVGNLHRLLGQGYAIGHAGTDARRLLCYIVFL